MNPEQEPYSNTNEQNPKPEQMQQTSFQPVVSSPQGNNRQKATILIALFIAVLIAVGASLFVLMRSDDDSAEKDQKTSSNNVAPESQVRSSPNNVIESENSTNAQKIAANNLLSVIAEYVANNVGVLPSTDAELQKIVTDSDLEDISVQVKESYAASDTPSDQSTFYYYKAHTCSEDTNTPVPGSSREFAILYSTPSGLQCSS